MRTPLIFWAGLLCLTLPLTSNAQDATDSPAEAEDAAADSDLQLLRDFGWMMSQNLNELDLSKSEQDAFVGGLTAGLAGEELVEEEAMPALNQRLQSYFRNRFMAQQDAENATFLAEIATEENVQQSASGLYYEIIEPGEGEKATQSDRVEVHYTGTLTDGTVFDSSRERGEPATFPVSGVVPGFGEGVQLVAPGGRVKLYIPPELGYRDQPQGQIPPRSVLVFDVEVLDVVSGEAAQPRPPMPEESGM